MRRLVLVALALVVLIGAGEVTAAAPKVWVGNDSRFQAAAEKLRWSGGTIVLRRGTYRDLSITGARSTRVLWVRTRPGVTVHDFTMRGSRYVRLVGVRLRYGRMTIQSSHHIRLTGVRFVKQARLSLRATNRVTISGSEFTRCGNLREDACLGTGWSQWRSSNLRVLGSWFHDCYGCDFIRGHIGSTFILRNSTLERAVPGSCGEFWHCNHQDGVQMTSGRNILIERNRFGLTYLGAGQLYFSKAMNGLTIRNNVFLGIDARLPDYIGWAAIVIGNHMIEQHVPRRVRIINNTVLTGSPRPDGLANSVYLSPSYANIPVAERPLVANNVLGLLRNPERLCTLGGVVTANVVRDGGACVEGGLVGDPMLTELGEPKEGSSVIDAGDPAWATPIDLFGFRRDAFPDIGAYEYRPR